MLGQGSVPLSYVRPQSYDFFILSNKLPPPLFFGQGSVPLSYMRPQSYDMWSVGVVFLELVLSSSKVCWRVWQERP